MERNQWSPCSGISGRHAPDFTVFVFSVLLYCPVLYFLEVIEDRHLSGSTIITSQLPIKEWHEFIGEKTIADAIMDRILHLSYKFEMKGDSLRKKHNKVD